MRHSAHAAAKHNAVLSGFTIVELLVVIVVIAILAAITIVVYNDISNRAKLAAFTTDLNGISKQFLVAKAQDDRFPSDTSGIETESTTTLSSYSFTANSFCVTVTTSELPTKTALVNETGPIQDSKCPVDGDYMQTITTANCLATRIRAVDARDNRTYWVQKLSDGRCWMLTSLSYAGGGTNTYGDVKNLSNGTSDASMTYTQAKYYVSSNANATTEPTAPSVATTGEGEYGYHYNWCAAMGNQQGTDACSGTDTTDVNTAITICPAGWGLPTGNTDSEFSALIGAIKGATNGDAGPKSTWLSQRSGSWYGSFTGQSIQYASPNAGNGLYWSVTPASTTNTRTLFLDQGSLTSSFSTGKNGGQSVRCVAAV